MSGNESTNHMVGKAGNLKAGSKVWEAVDACLGGLMEAVKKAGGGLFVTADHGNAEQMYDEESHQKHTQHTLNRVPALLFNSPANIRSLNDGKLAAVAPTLLALMQISHPQEMTAHSLLSEIARPHLLPGPRPAAAAS